MLARTAFAPRRKNAPRPPEKAAPGFLQWIRGRECIFAGFGDCEGKIEAMHLDFAGGKGIGTKVADRYALPACSGHHRRQHVQGWVTFLRGVGVSKETLLDGAARFWSKWPGRLAWEKRNGA